jgi:hypothetical protein
VLEELEAESEVEEDLVVVEDGSGRLGRLR